jgi:hypothetical protein
VTLVVGYAGVGVDVDGDGDGEGYDERGVVGGDAVCDDGGGGGGAVDDSSSSSSLDRLLPARTPSSYLTQQPPQLLPRNVTLSLKSHTMSAKHVLLLLFLVYSMCIDTC